MHIWNSITKLHSYAKVGAKQISMPVTRSIKKKVAAAAKEFKALCITGPRQSGKTTLARMMFPRKPYITLEDPDTALFATENTRAFLQQYTDGAILDEAHRVPQIFNYLQAILDKQKKASLFVLTGSNNFLMQASLSQTLAGRAGYIELLPFSYDEIASTKKTKFSLEKMLFTGGYPSLYSGKATPTRWMGNYIKTYLERDVRLLRNIGNLNQFQKFVKLCADRAAQILNIQNLSVDAGIDNKTALAWLGVLEASYIIHLLPPYYKNYSKRVIKTPKLYFYDNGLLCYLLDIKSESSIRNHQKKGALFENWCVTELKKNRFNAGQQGNLFYFRDSNGNEVDVLIEKNEHIIPIEIKSSTKFDRQQVNSIKWWQKLSRTENGILLYGGEKNDIIDENISVSSWREIGSL